jgi:cbb3-type cytochrome oxidase subunit 3
MNKKSVFTTILFIFIISNFILFLNINFTSATTAKELFNKSLDKTAEGTGHKGVGITEKELPQKIGEIIQAFLSFLGVIFLVLMIYGGYAWMMARGNEQEVVKAKNIITNAIIGLVIVLAAYAITLMMKPFWEGASTQYGDNWDDFY